MTYEYLLRVRTNHPDANRRDVFLRICTTVAEFEDAKLVVEQEARERIREMLWADAEEYNLPGLKPVRVRGEWFTVEDTGEEDERFAPVPGTRQESETL